MAKISFKLDTRSESKGGYQIRLRINNGNTHTFYPTGIRIEEKYFQYDSVYDPINPKAPSAVVKREKLSAIVRQYEEWLISIGSEELKSLSADEIRERIWGEHKFIGKVQAKRRLSGIKTDGSADFMDFFDKYGKGRQSVNTQKHFEYVWRLLYSYMKDREIQRISFSDIDYSLLADIKKFVVDGGRGDSTRFKVESYIRAAYREGQRMHIIGRDKDPFFDYRIKRNVVGEVIPADVNDMRKMLSVNLDGCEGIERARDILMISFYLCGANLLDIWGMPKPSGNEIVFIRHKVLGKTKQPIRIHIEPELQVLIDKYKGENTLFNFCEHSSNYYTFQRRLHKLFDGLEKRVGARVNFEMIRRSWATFAAHLEVADSVIDRSLGHMPSTVLARHYEQYDWGRTARANRAVIDYVLKGEE